MSQAHSIELHSMLGRPCIGFKSTAVVLTPVSCMRGVNVQVWYTSAIAHTVAQDNDMVINFKTGQVA